MGHVKYPKYLQIITLQTAPHGTHEEDAVALLKKISNTETNTNTK